jgi:hypothetical protein
MKTYLKSISMSIAAAALLMAGSARADDEAGNAAWEAGESANPDAIDNRNQKTEVAVDSKTSNAEAVIAESENPHSTLNQSQPVTADDSAKISLRVGEAGNPHSIDNAKQ